MAKKCGVNKPCGMRGGLFNPFFQNGVDIAGITGMGSSVSSNDILYEDGAAVRYEDNNIVLYE